MIDLKKLLRINRSSAVISFVALVLPIIGSVTSIYFVVNYPEITDWIKAHQILFFIGTSVTMAVLLTPTTFIASLSGYLFGLVSAFYLVPAYVLASLLGYFIGKKLDGGQLLSSLVEVDNNQILKKTVNANPFWFVVLCRISPVLPFGLMNVVLPAFGVKIKQFITAGTVGMLPRTVLFIWLGSSAQTVMEAIKGETNQPDYKFYLTSLLVLASSFGLVYLFKRKMKQLED